MSYCRFSDGDVYLFSDVSGGISCCCCRLAPLQPSIFTTGTNGADSLLLGEIKPCEQCQGQGCNACMMHGWLNFNTEVEALRHLLDHELAGHDVPDYAMDRLVEEIVAGTTEPRA